MDNAVDFSTIQSVLENNAGKVENLIESYVDKKEQLISLLQDIQAEFNYIPQDVLVKISQTLDIPLSQVFSVATFFQAFSLKPRGRHTITVCMGTACHIKGGQRLVDKMERDFGLKSGETTEDQRFSLETANCLDMCGAGPNCIVYPEDVAYNYLDEAALKKIVDDHFRDE